MNQLIASSRRSFWYKQRIVSSAISLSSDVEEENIVMDSGNTVDLSDSDLALLESLVQYFDNEMEAVEEHAIRYNGKITFFSILSFSRPILALFRRTNFLCRFINARLYNIVHCIVQCLSE